MEDFFNRKKQLDTEQYARYSRYTVLFWGLVCLVLAFFTGDIAKTVIEAINKIGSVFYGPILATFVAAIGWKRIHTLGANLGLIGGVLVNVDLWLFVPDVFWFWWNAVGAVVTLFIAYMVSILVPGKSSGEQTLQFRWERDPVKTAILIGFFILIVLVSVNIQNWL